MKDTDLFKLIVRAFGVFLLYRSVSMVAEATVLLAWPVAGSYFVRIAALLAAAIWFLFGAPPIQQWAYPDEERRSRAAARRVDVVPEVEGGTPCVACRKRIAPDAEICPFCGWTQPK